MGFLIQFNLGLEETMVEISSEKDCSSTNTLKFEMLWQQLMCAIDYF